MKIESLKEVPLTNAKDTFLFDCRVAGVDFETRSAYREVLTSFIRFTGNILVEELTVDHVHMYIANLSDGPSEGDEHTRTVITHYALIHEWVRWLCAQKFIIYRPSSFVEPPRYLTRRFDLWLGVSDARNPNVDLYNRGIKYRSITTGTTEIADHKFIILLCSE